MSRRISVNCDIKHEGILEEAITDLGLDYHKPGENVYRFRSSVSGHALMYGGLTLLKSGDTYKATFDEDCRLSRATLGQITQSYLKSYYLLEAMRQGDQILREYVSQGHEQDPLIEPGDVVIIATKG